jgi:hypothetical protein
MQDHGVTSLLMRDAEMARQGGERWTATCKRLRLPLPPPDASAPYVFSEWRTVAQWDTASQVRGRTGGEGGRAGLLREGAEGASCMHISGAGGAHRVVSWRVGSADRECLGE